MEENKTDTGLIRSEEVQEIIGTPPHWLFRYGLGILLLIVLGLLITSYFIDYPEILQIPLTIKSQSATCNVSSPVNGVVSKICVNNNQDIVVGSILCVLDNSSSLDSVLKLKTELAALLETPQFSSFRPSYIKGGLGELWPQYQKIHDILRECQSISSDDLQLRKIAHIKNQIALEEHLAEEIETNKNINEDQSQILLTTKVSIEEQQKNIIEIQEAIKEKRQNSETKLKEALAVMKAQLENWDKTYILRAPVDGKVAFVKYWEVNQNIAANDILFTIVPKQTSTIAIAYLPVSKREEVNIGQMVNINVGSYPIERYGTISGKIATISDMPIEEHLIMTIDFPNGLVTSFNKEIPFFPEMKAEGQIILKEEKLIHKLFKELSGKPKPI